MRLRGGEYRCVHCEVVLEVPEGAEARAIYVNSSDKPPVRVILIDGELIHRCALQESTD
jgi:hypothetical protein